MVVVSVVVVHALKNNASEKLTNPRKTYFQLKNTDGLLGIRSEAGLAIIIQVLTTKSLVPMRFAAADAAPARPSERLVFHERNSARVEPINKSRTFQFVQYAQIEKLPGLKLFNSRCIGSHHIESNLNAFPVGKWLAADLMLLMSARSEEHTSE